MRKWGWHRANEQPCGTETKPIIKCYWGWKMQINPFLKRWIGSHTHINLSPSSLHPESYFETILHKPGEGLHPSAKTGGPRAASVLPYPESLTCGQWQQKPPDFHLYRHHRGRDGPAFTPPWTLFLIRKLKEWLGSHHSPKNSQHLPPLTPIKSLASIVLLYPKWWIQ